jgi:hypothetical protein
LKARAIYFAVAGLFLAACGSTKITYLAGQRLVVPPGSTVLVNKFAEKSDYESQNHFESVKQKLSSKCYSFEYIPEFDYDLRLVGLAPEKIYALDTAALNYLHRWKPGSYLITFLVERDVTINSRMMQGNIAMNPMEVNVPVRRTGIIAVIQSLEDAEQYWAIQVDADIRGVMINSKGVNMYKSAYGKSLKEAVKHLKERGFMRCE